MKRLPAVGVGGGRAAEEKFSTVTVFQYQRLGFSS